METHTIPYNLSPAETRVLDLVKRGKSNKEIAGELFISQSTVSAHMRNLLQKTHSDNRTELVVEAFDERLGEPMDAMNALVNRWMRLRSRTLGG